MIITNGYIQTITTTEGGIVEGIPTPAREELSEPIPCNIVKNQSDHKGTYVDGKFSQNQGTILIDPQEFNAERIKVTDNRGKEIGTFEVQDVQLLEATGALQIKY